MDTHKAQRVLRSIQKIPHERFVLHGSLTRSNTLLPNKPTLKTFRNTRKAKGLKEKAVYATRLTHVAVVYATLPNDTAWRLNKKGKCLNVLAREPEVSLFSGYIHVCRAASFDRGRLITTSGRAVKVVRTFKITPDVFAYLWHKQDLRLSDHL